jgi:hypothetical protein
MEKKDLRQNENKAGASSNKPRKYYMDFPYAQNYQSMESIAEAFPHLKSVNDPNCINLKNIKNAYSFVIRSNNDDDIHKVIAFFNFNFF